ncbi:MAG: glycosyltransferase family 4 protein [Candidatus Micrarchaeota archaeon]|nr:glycosyltransferase family 4 protein [Candidatus Micrarchaeota archaeon]
MDFSPIDSMKVAIVNVTKPVSGTGDGMTEYTYQLIKNLGREGVRVGSFYALTETRRRNMLGLARAQTLLRNKVAGIIAGNYDIVHITNQEAGFVAKELKKQGYYGRIVTTVHDTMRLRDDLHRGAKQKIYNYLVRHHVKDAMDYSDELIFDEPKTMKELGSFGRFGRYKIVFLGVDERFAAKKAKRKGPKFVVGYLGSFAHNKNVGFVLRAAELMRNEKGFRFDIYGSGGEIDSLVSYKKANGLENVRFLGFAPENRKREIYDGFDAFVFPTVGEVWSIPIMEAMARELPVIIPRSSDIVGSVREHCLEVKDEKGMASLLSKLRKRGVDSGFVKDAAKFARSLTWRRTARETLKHYRELLG